MSRGGRGGRGGLTSVTNFFNEPAFNSQMQNNYSSRPNTRSSMGRMQQSPQQQMQQPMQQQMQQPMQMQQIPDPPQIVFATPKHEETQIPGLFTSSEPKENLMENQPLDNNGDVSMEQTESVNSSPKKPKKFIPGRRGNFIGGKVSKHIMKRRQNARLRTILTPKNSMMVLYELHPELKLTISEEVSATNQMTYTVKIEIDGRPFVGQGMSKAAAKQAASENALKAVLLEKLEQNNVRLSSSNAPVAEDSEMAMAPPAENTELPKPEGDQADSSMEQDAVKKPKKRIPEDDVPWGSLASFALYKLFSEWQSQGFQLPANAGISGIFQKSVAPPPSASMTPKKLPPDANQKHPVQLLNQVRPGSQYIESREGVPPNLTFTFTVIVDGKTYRGTGTNKKEAKKQCAKSVLEAMGVQYD